MIHNKGGAVVVSLVSQVSQMDDTGRREGALISLTNKFMCEATDDDDGRCGARGVKRGRTVLLMPRVVDRLQREERPAASSRVHARVLSFVTYGCHRSIITTDHRAIVGTSSLDRAPRYHVQHSRNQQDRKHGNLLTSTFFLNPWTTVPPARSSSFPEGRPTD